MKERLDRLFDTIAKNSLKINLKKCIFGVQELTFVGLKLTNKKIIPDLSKVDAVKKPKVPTNVSKNFFTISKLLLTIYTMLGKINKTLRKLKKKNLIFNWSN